MSKIVQSVVELVRLLNPPAKIVLVAAIETKRRPFDSLCHLVQSTVLVYDCVVKVNPQSVVEAHQAIF